MNNNFKRIRIIILLSLILNSILFIGNTQMGHNPEGSKFISNEFYSNPINNEIQVINQLKLADMAMGIDVEDNFAFIACYREGIQCVDLSNPLDPIIVGECEIPWTVFNIYVEDHIAFVSGSQGIYIINVEDPSNPYVIGDFGFIEKANAIFIQGSIAYVGRTSGFYSYDITNLYLPILLGSYEASGSIEKVKIEDNHAYIVTGSNELLIFNIIDPSNLNPAGIYDNFDVEDLEIRNGIAYVANGQYGFQIFDISDLGNIVLLGEMDDIDASLIRIQNNYAFIRVNGVFVVDISNPNNPVLLDSIYMQYSVYDFALTETVAYFACSSTGLVCVDITDIKSQIDFGCNTPGTARDITIKGDIAYVADGEAGLQCIDISNPEIPEIIGNYPTPDAYHVEISGNVAYITDGTAYLYCIDISDPTNPVLLGDLKTNGIGESILIDGDYAYFADGPMGLMYVDINNPENPIEMGYKTLGWVYDVDRCGNILFLADKSNGLYCLDVTNPVSPIILSLLNINSPVSIEIHGDLAFLAAAYSIKIINISNPLNPLSLTSLSTSYNVPSNIHVEGNLLYISEGNAGVEIFDISDIYNPILLEKYDTPGYTYDTEISGNYMYIADGEWGIQCKKISELIQPTFLDDIDIPNGNNLIVDGDYAFLATDLGLSCLNINNQFDLTRAGTCDTFESSYDLEVDGNIAYLANGILGVQFINISNVYNPFIIDLYATPGIAYDLEVSGRIMYVADGDSGIQCISVDDTSNLFTYSTYPTIGSATNLHIDGNILYVIEEGQGLLVLNLNNPQNPVFLGRYDLPEISNVLALHGSIIYLTDNIGNLISLDITNPLEPRLSGSIHIGEKIHEISICGDKLLIADGNNGLLYYDISDPQNPVFDSAFHYAGEITEIVIDGMNAYIIDYNYGIIALRLFRFDWELTKKPFLSPIQYDAMTGIMEFDWSDISVAEVYSIYQYHSLITEINSSVTQLATVSDSTFQINHTDEGLFFYCIRASNQYSYSLSNCQSIQVSFLGLTPPLLSPIVPFPSTNGNIFLQWSETENAESYRIYRYTSPITQINSSITLLASSTELEYIDTVLENGEYYYAIEALNSILTSPLSNCEGVIVAFADPEENQPIDHPNIPVIDFILNRLLEYDTGMDMCIDNMGNMYIVGMVTDLDTGFTDVYLLKFNIMGVLIFECLWDSGRNEIGTGVCTDKSGNIYITGNILGDIPIENDIFLLKFNPNGELEWEYIWQGNGYDESNCVGTDSLGNIYVTGLTQSFGVSNPSGYILQINSQGCLIWQSIWSSGTYNIGKGLVIDSENDIYIIGESNGDASILKYNSNGDLIWKILWGGTNVDQGEAIAYDPRGYIYITGNTFSYGAGLADLFLLKYSLDGEFMWALTYGDTTWEGGNDITIDLFGNIYVLGRIGEPPEHLGVIVLKFNSLGDLKWNYISQSTQQEEESRSIENAKIVNAICVDNFGNIYTTGGIENSNELVIDEITYDDPDPKMGDVNGDDLVDIIDSLLIAQYYVGFNPNGFINPEAADVNNDGLIDIVDSLLIAQYFVS